MSSVLIRFAQDIARNDVFRGYLQGAKVLYGFLAQHISQWVLPALANIVIYDYISLYDIQYRVQNRYYPSRSVICDSSFDFDPQQRLLHLTPLPGQPDNEESESEHNHRTEPDSLLIELLIPATGFISRSALVLRRITIAKFVDGWAHYDNRYQEFDGISAHFVIKRSTVVRGTVFTFPVHKLSLNSPWFDHVKSGRKLYEGRRRTETVKKWQIGDRLQISHHTDPYEPKLPKIIKSLQMFATFEDALKTLGLERVLPDVRTIEEGIEIYKRFVSIPTQLKDGVCMIELQ
jgi:ASC-1-like (ASCH) protein